MCSQRWVQRGGLEVYLFKLVIKLVKQCVLCDWWEVIHLPAYSAWEMFLVFLNDQLINAWVMPLLEPVIDHCAGLGES